MMFSIGSLGVGFRWEGLLAISTDMCWVDLDAPTHRFIGSNFLGQSGGGIGWTQMMDLPPEFERQFLSLQQKRIKFTLRGAVSFSTNCDVKVELLDADGNRTTVIDRTVACYGILPQGVNTTTTFTDMRDYTQWGGRSSFLHDCEMRDRARLAQEEYRRSAPGRRTMSGTIRARRSR